MEEFGNAWELTREIILNSILCLLVSNDRYHRGYYLYHNVYDLVIATNLVIILGLFFIVDIDFRCEVF